MDKIRRWRKYRTFNDAILDKETRRPRDARNVVKNVSEEQGGRKVDTSKKLLSKLLCNNCCTTTVHHLFYLKSLKIYISLLAIDSVKT